MHIEQRVLDNLTRLAYIEISNSPKVQTYCLLKCDFIFESCLDHIWESKFAKAFHRFKISTYNLNNGTGRYANIPRSEHLCHKCNMNAVRWIWCSLVSQNKGILYTISYANILPLMGNDNLVYGFVFDMINITEFVFYKIKRP